MRHPVPASVLIALLALGLAALAGNDPGWAASQTLSVSAAKKKPHPPRRQTGQIACTITGCIRIPPGCHPEMGYDIHGNPTGFDIVVCPERRR